MSERVDRLVAELTLDEKASLTAGADLWSIPGVDRVGIPAISVTDGPNGARGTGLFGLGGETAVCIPCGSALGATWNPELIERVGVMLGEEAHTKSARVLLAPTVNLHRSPTAGRNFECYSEDPLLAGRIAAAFVRGVQSQGIVTTVKHFVGNETEFERNTSSSVIDERTLRELYLVPFELAVREGGALGIMTAYNRLNGTFCTEDATLLTEVLRDDWGFTGVVVTDWFGAATTEGSIRAGLDLEMPGPGRAFGPALAAAVRAGRVTESTVDDTVRRYLGVLERTGALDAPPPGPSRSVDRPEHRALAREAAVDATVLLQNDGTLPLDLTTIRTIALIGPNAERPQMMGGGSAALAPHYRISPLEALRDRVGPAVAVVHERGCVIDRTTPALAPPRVASPDGEPGVLLERFVGADCSGEPVERRVNPDGRVLVLGDIAAAPDAPPTALRIRAVYTPDETGVHSFTFVQAGGTARAWLDGALAFDGVSDPPPPGRELVGMGSREVSVAHECAAGVPVAIEAEFASPPGPGFLHGMKLGCRLPESTDLMTRAAEAAAAADVAVVVVGTNDDWETEGHDRESMDLPGDQDALVRRVAAANPRTVVVVNTGSPVTMDWADAVPAVLQSWFGGQEMAHALVDVLTGVADPGGRLPTTIPLRLEHTPAFGNFPGENSEVRYGEGLLVGYRWYDTRHLPVRFPFGHGLSYASFAIGPPSAPASFTPGEPFVVDVPVENTGTRRGVEVVQCYVEPVAPRRTRPRRELRAFAKVALDPGERTTVRLALDDRAFAYWDPADPWWAAHGGPAPFGPVPAGGASLHREAPGWYVDPGDVRLHVGRSSTDLPHVVTVGIAA